MRKEDVKIACIGNMNNNFSVLMRYLNHMGYDTDLLLFSHEQDHFQPENDTFLGIDPSKIKKLSWGNRFRFIGASKQEIRESVKPYHFIIACGVSPAFLHKAGIVPTILIPYGGDVLFYPFYKFTKKIWHLLDQNLFAWHQRQALKKIPYYFLDYSNERFESTVSKLQLGQRIFLPVPMVFTPEFNSKRIGEYALQSALYAPMKKIREAHDMVIFHNSRHLWMTNLHIRYNKGNNKLIEAVAACVKEHPAAKIALVTFEYGLDVENSKNLIRELGIEANVFWFPLQPRKELFVAMSMADMVVGELNYSFYSYGVVMEAMAMGKPILHKRDDALYRDKYTDMYPMVFASDVQELVTAFSDFLQHPDTFRAIGAEAEEWFHHRIVEATLGKIENIIQEKLSLTAE